MVADLIPRSTKWRRISLPTSFTTHINDPRKLQSAGMIMEEHVNGSNERVSIEDNCPWKQLRCLFQIV